MKHSQGKRIKMLVKSIILIVLIVLELSQAQTECYGPKTEKNTFHMQNCEFSDFDLGDSRLLLMKVYAVNNKVQYLNDLHLKGAKELIEIEVCSNEIKDISCRTFEDQEKLTKLNLGENLIELLNAGIFDTLVNLEELTLEDNQIKIIEKDLFKKNLNLKIVNLKKNEMFAIDRNAFTQIKSEFKLIFLENVCANVMINSLEYAHANLEKCYQNYGHITKLFNASNFCQISNETTARDITILVSIISLSVLLIILAAVVYFIWKFHCQSSNAILDNFSKHESYDDYCTMEMDEKIPKTDEGNAEEDHHEFKYSEPYASCTVDLSQKNTNESMCPQNAVEGEQNQSSFQFPIYATVQKT